MSVDRMSENYLIKITVEQRLKRNFVATALG